MNENTPVSEPNFEGEAMKVPEGSSHHTPVAGTEPGTSFGLILALLFLALVLILGGMYFWYRTVTSTPPVIIPESLRPTAEENTEPESTTAAAQADALNVVSSSNELDAISADLESTNIDTLTAELQAIDNTIEGEVTSQ